MASPLEHVPNDEIEFEIDASLRAIDAMRQERLKSNIQIDLFCCKCQIILD